MHAQASEIRSKVRGFCWLLFFHNFEGGKIFALDLMSLIVCQWRCEKTWGLKDVKWLVRRILFEFMAIVPAACASKAVS